MLRRPLRLIALACTAALAAAMIAGPSNAAVPKATAQGVTKDSVKVVVYVPPLDLQKNPPAGGQPPTNRSA